MAFESTKREVGELYAFVRLLADGNVSMGRADGAVVSVSPSDASALCAGQRQVVMVERMEHDGPRRYLRSAEKELITIICGTKERNGRFVESAEIAPREVSCALFDALSNALLDLLRSSNTQEVVVPDDIEEVLDELKIYDLEANTNDRTDLIVTFDAPWCPAEGIIVRSRLGAMNPLLDGGRSANLKLELTGIKFAVPTVNKINALPESADEVCQRMLMIERLGGVLRYADVADKVFRCNLGMIDLHFGRLLAEMVRLMHLEDITRITQLTERMEVINPLKIKDELISKHGYYRHKMRSFLLALAMGLRPAKIYTGRSGSIAGMLLVQTDGSMVLYDSTDTDTFAEFLYQNCRLLKGDVEKDKYGFLERENGVYYFKLNIKIGLLKR